MVQISGDSVKVATVTKANDQEEGALTKFKGEIVILGKDEDGDDITTMIISTDPCESASGKSKENTPLTSNQRRAMDLLYAAINDAGEAPPASAPHGVVRWSRSIPGRTAAGTARFLAAATTPSVRRSIG
jgi:hypothetical protein